MKNVFTLMVITALTITVCAQSPQKMSYQCVVRNSAGALIANQAVGMKISIIKGSATGTVVFSETYSPNPQTNANGLVTVEIGGGTASVGTFAGIDWSDGIFFLKTETDPSGGTNYNISGTTQLLSVPYALYAKTAANGFSGNYNDLSNKPVLFSGSYNDLTNKPALFDGAWSSLTGKPTTLSGYGITDADGSITNEIQSLSLSGTLLSLSNGGGTVTIPSSGGGDNWGTQTVVTNTTLTGAGTTASPLAVANTVITPSWTRIQGIPAGFADGTDNIDDADNSITNEIQALSLSGTVLSLSNGGGSVTLPSSGGGDNWGTQSVVTDLTLAGNGTTITPLRVAQQSATNGQVLKWNGTTWAPAADATGTGSVTLPWSGNAATGIDNYVLSVESTGQDISAIRGRQTNTTTGSSGYGVYGESLSPYGTGVYAYSNGSNGRGLYASGHVAVRANGNYRGVDANGDKAVEGRSYSATGFGVGGYSPVCGVYGETWNSGGNGVHGKSTGDPLWDITCGVYGEANTEQAWGVKGYVSDTIGANYGVYGESNSIHGYGVGGTARKHGVYGKSTGFQGIGVEGEALADNSIGVSGKALSANGTGVYGEGNRQGIYGISSNTGVYGTSTGYKGIATVGEATGTNSVGVQGTALNSNGTGVWGEGDNQGVYGISAKITGKGVYGSVSSTTGANYGVYGETTSPAGYGVYGTGPTYGIYGTSNGANGFGVYGKSTSGTGYGVYGDALRIGVYGVSASTTGTGVYGEAQRYGVYGFASVSTGYGIYGEAPVYGVHGRSTGTTGRAVVGEASGTGSIGVMGLGNNTSSTGVWGEGANYDFYAAGAGTNYGAASSIRWKTNITPIPDPVGKILAIRGVYYDWDTEHGGQHDVGMIAEEVGKVLPEIVVYEENGVDASGMDYSKITPLLVEAIKAQQIEIELIKAEYERLKSESEQMKTRLEKIEKLITVK